MSAVKVLITGGIVVAFTIAAGVLHGVETHRWGDPELLARRAARVDELPHRVGDWTSVEVDVTEREIEMSGADAFHSRRFTNVGSSSGSIRVMLLSGPTGPIACHPPTVCFVGAGYELESGPVPVTTETGDTLWCADFRSPSPNYGILRAFWGWDATGRFEAPDWPRVDLAGNRQLYKVYFTRFDRTIDVDPENDPALKFASEYLSVAHPVLHPSGN